MVMFMVSTFFGKELNVIGSNVSSDKTMAVFSNFGSFDKISPADFI